MQKEPFRLTVLVGALLGLWIVVYWLWPAQSQDAADGVEIGFGDAADTARSGEPAVTQMDESSPYAVHVASEGETFESIAADQLGDGERWPEIARANPMKDPRRVVAGDELRVPTAGSDSADLIDAAVLAEPVFAEYLVQPGDTLGGISLKLYGTTRHAEAILAANRATLASAEALRAGSTIRVPSADAVTLRSQEELP